MSRLAAVLFNLGGPDGPKAVRPFLFNLFKDPAILNLPAIVRYPLAALISRTRQKTAQENYAQMGGCSPLLPQTEAQAQALEAELNRRGYEARVFVAMRHWKPFAAETSRAVADFAPDEIVLLPLYPQYSTTTTGSSLADWRAKYRGPGQTRTVCCYPTATGLIEAHAAAVHDVWTKAQKPKGLRLLFSAHGLPQKVVDGGDPYRAQIEATAAAIAASLPEFPDWRVSFQSRIGPLTWLEPSTGGEIQRAGAEGRGVIVSPIAFVSEHVETLVELDHEYAALAADVGVGPYLRAATPGVAPSFIACLADAALQARGDRDLGPFGSWRCSGPHSKCPCAEGS